MTESLGITIAAVFALRVPKEELLSRYAKINPFVYRSDEKKMEVVEQRIRVFDEETEEVLKYYQSVKTSVFDIDGKQTPDLVTKNIAAYLYDIL
ncbi:hypothetical protein KA478_04020 [Patescibacteria group bacterium]|nr:hypothetical protein [Patescibacteria group bacterium]